MGRRGRIARASEGRLFVVARPDGRESTRIFRSPIRAAEHVMRAAKCDWWPDLAARGVRVVAYK